MRPRPPPGSAFATTGSAASAPTNLLLFIFPGSKVLTEQPELFSCLLAQGGDLGHVGSPWGSAEPGQPRAVMPATARRPEAGREMCYAITVLGVFIALGSACWKMLPRPPSKICSF